MSPFPALEATALSRIGDHSCPGDALSRRDADYWRQLGDPCEHGSAIIGGNGRLFLRARNDGCREATTGSGKKATLSHEKPTRILRGGDSFLETMRLRPLTGRLALFEQTTPFKAPTTPSSTGGDAMPREGDSFVRTGDSR
jgi:hypothetical protein